MTRKIIDCRAVPHGVGCTLAITGDPGELITAACGPSTSQLDRICQVPIASVFKVNVRCQLLRLAVQPCPRQVPAVMARSPSPQRGGPATRSPGATTPREDARDA
jgi:hypothetical protein